MSLKKAIEHHKEHRKPYRGGASIDATCRNHGSCPACYMNRTYANQKRLMESNDKLKEWRDDKY